MKTPKIHSPRSATPLVNAINSLLDQNPEITHKDILQRLEQGGYIVTSGRGWSKELATSMIEVVLTVRAMKP